MNRSQWMCIVLIFALAGNSCLHFIHPAYREYIRIGRDLSTRFDAFRGEVVDSFAPLVSNVVALLSRPVPLQSPDVNTTADLSQAVKTSMPLVVGARLQETAHLSYARCGDSDYVVINGLTPLTVGDDLFGYPIRRISKTSVLTDASLFLFAPSESVSSVSNVVGGNDDDR